MMALVNYAIESPIPGRGILFGTGQRISSLAYGSGPGPCSARYAESQAGTLLTIHSQVSQGPRMTLAMESLHL
jgi:hypothetical protein